MTEEEIEAEIKRIVFKHLSPKEYQIFVYGSRATGRARQWSDWDIGVMGKTEVPLRALSEISTKLEESDLPVNVDIVDFAHVTERFKNLALYKIIPWTT